MCKRGRALTWHHAKLFVVWTVRLHSRTGRSRLYSFFLNSAPGLLDVSFHCVRLAYTESQREAIIQTRVCQVEIPATVQSIHQRLIHFVPAFVAKANQVERCRCCQFESIVFLHPLREFLRQLNVTANV